MVATRRLSPTRNGQVTFEDLRGGRAEGYIRDSKIDQRDGYGPELQRRAIQAFAGSYGLVLGDAWYTDFITGRSTLNRSAFHHAIMDAEADLYDVLLVYHTSRFARNRGDAIKYKSQLQNLSKVVVFVSQGIVSGNDDDFLTEGISEVLDEHYSRNLSRWVRDGLKVKASLGHSLGSPPLGYKHAPRSEGRGVRMVPDEKTMPILMALLAEYATGAHSFRTLAQCLNAQGYRTTRDRPFTESSVSTTLNNPFYVGKLIYHRNRSDEEVIDGTHEVPHEVCTLWKRCQEVRQDKNIPGQPAPASRKHNVFPLTGILKCDNCGEPFHGVTNRQNGKGSRRMFHSFKSCHIRPLSISAPRIEDEFAERVLPYLTLDDGWRTAVLQAICKEGPKPVRSIELARVESALANLRKQHLWGAVTDEQFKREYQALESQRKTLGSNPVRDVTPNLERAAELLSDLPKLWDHPGVALEQRRDLAREVFEELRLREGELVAVRPRPTYAPLFAYSIWRNNVVGGDCSS